MPKIGKGGTITVKAGGYPEPKAAKKKARKPKARK